MKFMTFTESLAQLERTDPAVAAAARSFDRTVDDLNYRAALHAFRPLPWDRSSVPLDTPVVADGEGVTSMTLAKCTHTDCNWEVDIPGDEFAADAARVRHEARRHLSTPPSTPLHQLGQPAEPIAQLANVDWWARAIDGLTQLARESMATGEPFTIYEVSRFGVGEPLNPRTDWGKFARDAEHLRLIVHARDEKGRELSTRSVRPATKGSLVALWQPGPAITGAPKTRSDTA